MIALVDDEKNVRLGIKTALKHEGFETCEFCNGKEAYDAVKGGLNAELFVMDIMMPVMDGYQALKAIRDIEVEKGIPTNKRVKIVMMTALNEERNVKKAFEMGCTVYCAKPVDVDRLKGVLQKLSLI